MAKIIGNDALGALKTWILNKLSGKSDTGHTHTKSQITDFPTIPSKTSQLTNDSGFLTSHQDISGKENSSNKVTSWSTTTTDAHYPSEKLVKNALDGKASSSHTHDDRYYTKTDSDTKYLPKSHGYATAITLSGATFEGRDDSFMDVIVEANGSDEDAIINFYTSGESIVNATYLAENGVLLSGKYASKTHNHSASDITSGTFDLGRIPTIPSTKTSGFATVATSGSYNDLKNPPTIPTVNNSTITITQGGTTKGSFTLNQGSGATIALDASSQKQSDWNQSNTTAVDYIKNKPSTFPPSSHNHNDLYYTETEVNTLLDGKANSTHTHSISNITNLKDTLDGKASANGSYPDMSVGKADKLKLNDTTSLLATSFPVQITIGTDGVLHYKGYNSSGTGFVDLGTATVYACFS